MIFLDTDIAIAVRDGDLATRDRVAALTEWPVLSTMTRIELENGVHRGDDRPRRRALLDRMVQTFRIEPLGEQDVRTYGSIVGNLGHDRRRTIDRLIAAQAIACDAVPVTRNGRDFRSIAGLRLEVWDDASTG